MKKKYKKKYKKITKGTLELLAWNERCMFKDCFIKDFTEILIFNFKWDKINAYFFSISLWNAYKQKGIVEMFQFTLACNKRKEINELQKAIVIFLNRLLTL